MKFLKKLTRMKFRQLRMIPEAAALTAWYRFRILHCPFSKLAPGLGAQGAETPLDIPRDPIHYEVKGAVEAVSKRMPWNCNCLTQAMTAKKMLARRGISSTLYMGVAPTETGEMEAHAWLRCGTLCITGQSGWDRFTVTAVFGDDLATEREKACI